MGRAPGLGLIFKGLVGRIGRRAERVEALSYLLDASELPGDGWSNSREGSIRSVSTPFRRGPKLRCVGASRNYRKGVNPVRYLFIEVDLTDSPEHAIRLAERARTRYYRKPGVTVVAERDITLPGRDLSPLANTQMYERDTERDAKRYTNRVLSGTLGDVVVRIHAGGSGGGWDWDDVADFAIAQANKCQGTAGIPRGRTAELPVGGQQNSTWADSTSPFEASGDAGGDVV